MNHIVGASDIILITLDTLRYDVAQHLFRQGKLPNFSKWLPKEGWEKRHTPGSFTYAAHHAFFAGFLPTKTPNKQARLFAAKFKGSETTTPTTFVFDEENIAKGLQKEGYKTACIGGVGFFNKQTSLSKVIPNMFEESYWETKFGVTDKDSTFHQLQKAKNILESTSQNVFLFINIAALHQPNYYYLNTIKNKQDTIESHSAALEYIDSQLPILMESLKKRKQSSFVICTSDHGTTYGEDGFNGHRLAHENVWNIPYFEKWID